MSESYIAIMERSKTYDPKTHIVISRKTGRIALEMMDEELSCTAYGDARVERERHAAMMALKTALEMHHG